MSVRLLASTAVLACALGCSAERRGHPSPGILTPLAASRAPSGADAPRAQGSAPTLDFEAFTPLLSLPELAPVAAALEAEDKVSAARGLEALMAKRPPGADSRSYRFLLARLREAASDFDGAASAYTLAAADAWSLTGYSRLGAGRALLRAGHPKEALESLAAVPMDGPMADEARLLSADAAMALGDVERAIASLRDYLARAETGADTAAASLELGAAIVARVVATNAQGSGTSEAAREAIGLARKVLARATDMDRIAKAHALETEALALLPVSERSAFAVETPTEHLERLKALVDARQFEAARPVADALVSALGTGDFSKLGCDARLLQAIVLAGTHESQNAESVATDVGRHCDDRDTRARALFLAGKYATSAKRYMDAVKHFETLEAECPDSKLADDARLKRALCYRELGVEARFTELLARMPDDYPDGDMVLDGSFELAVRRIEKGDWAGASTILDRAITALGSADAERGQEFAGRERYFRARAFGALGDVPRSLSEYEAIIRELPLSYYMLHAYSRLESADATRARHALSSALEAAAHDPFTFARRPEFDRPGFIRALELLRVGDVDGAAREIDALGFSGPSVAPPILWAVALLYDRAGAAKLSHAVVRGLSRDWLPRWPSGDWARAWQIAFPRPYHALVAREAKRNDLEEWLVYAIMREESSFDPAAESPVRAYGLMQLIEPTARQFAKPLGIRSDAGALQRPAVNVTLGCRLLADLTRSFPDNPLLAIPGYNAGATRPRRWTSEHATVDFDVWVELIPFQETRRYTKRVLATRATYAFLYDREHAESAMRLPIEIIREDQRREPARVAR